MRDVVVPASRALFGWLVVATLLLLPALPAAAATTTCGGGELEVLQDDRDPTVVIGARVSGIGPDCEGQPVGIQFLGNDEGDPALPATELARAHSDEGPCTGEDQPGGVLRDGTVDVLLCEGSATSGHVDGEQLTRMLLITAAAAVPAGPDDPAPAPAPPVEGDLPVTGADVLRAVLLGAAMVLAGSGLLRLGRVGRSHLP